MTPSRLVVRMPNWLGDVVMALPALAAVRATWPEGHLSVALPRGFVPIVSCVPGIDGVVPLAIGRGWRGREAFRQDTATLAAGAFDAALLFTNSFASAWMLRKAGIAQRWGYRSDLRGLLLTRAVPRLSSGAGADRHHSRYYGRLVMALGCQAPDYRVRLQVPDAWREQARALLPEAARTGRPLVGFAPGAAYGTAKQWPPPLVAQAIEQCRHELDAVCVLCGTTADAAVGEAIRARLSPRTDLVDLIGRTDLPALAGVMAACDAFVANDSGPMHLASALGVPVVAPFGATDETATAPMGPHQIVRGEAWCRPCLRRECPTDHRCMWSIPADVVVRAVAVRVRPARTGTLPASVITH